MAEKGMLIVVSAPSGTGKGAIIEKLLADDGNITHSVSATTRKPFDGRSRKKCRRFWMKGDIFRLQTGGFEKMFRLKIMSITGSCWRR